MDWFQTDVQFVLSLLAEGKINPLISHRIPLSQVEKAHEVLEDSLAVRKVVPIND